MALGERDPHTGWSTTGHEWNGIRELNTPVPRLVWICLALTAAVSVVYWLLMPAWPLLNSHTPGLLGNDQRADVRAAIRAADAGERAWMDAVLGPVESVREDPALMASVRETGGMLFAEHCAACHGRDGAGGPGFPRLTDRSWQWGGDPATIEETLRVGINSLHPESRIAVMQGWGRDGLLDRETVLGLVSLIRGLSGLEEIGPAATLASLAYADNCADCHGQGARGIADLGGPNLADADWLYGSDRDSVFDSIWSGRQGWMPDWEDRLTAAERRILTLYVLELAGAEDPS